MFYSDAPEQIKTGMTFEEIIRASAAEGRIEYGNEDRAEAWIEERLARHRDASGHLAQHRELGQWVQITERRTQEGGTVVVYTDITSLKNAEAELESANNFLSNQTREHEELAQQLIHARDEAERANRVKSEFLANMSHELRTPLNAIIGFSEILSEQALGPVSNPTYLEYIRDIHASGTHLLNIISDILDLSKAESSHVELIESDIDVAFNLQACVKMIAQKAEENDIELGSDVASDLPALRGDARKFKQIFINLLSNAVKFTPAGGTVTIKAWHNLKSGYVFQVADTGIGIALEDIPKAFTPFQQIDGALDRKYEGTGLGLPLTRSLSEIHGGSLDLQSELGVGTTVTVRFPAERIVGEKSCAEGIAPKRAGAAA
jgi:two-component system cell cycle sensor histidine kinase PleC